ncbi:MAG: 16S rRNA (adenine(1518)-N(6)/adenine(1519)-N(6))-dimethyltransferase RsmA [Candidatus Marsarchaeota archaeon]|jgi:16S rRNA (adenine1518-N6/adenine1519-N6)-dimethyltransferase|nr:16S rRNA (adenine(1518)-N(6)/adenine(1519)-N(6))-dimethyltransferase RsmA [Candidatus Marsarchaeota archaeon]
MDNDYRQVLKNLRAHKRLGQNFLVNADIAKAEAEYARNRVVVELGPGLGILTRELSAVAKRVIAIEKDKRLFDMLSYDLHARNVTLVNSDFFAADERTFTGAEIMVSNVPYNLSSKVLMWLAGRRLEAVLCLQKEFVEHMLAKPGTRKYSKLSVVSSLQFKVSQMMNVGRNNFYPVPRVDSALVHLGVKNVHIEPRASAMLALLMEHKKKLVRNAVIDSSKELYLSKEEAARIAGMMRSSNARVFKMGPEELLAAATELADMVHRSNE